MKTNKKFKLSYLGFFFAAFSLFAISSCKNNTKEDTTEVAEDHNDAKFNESAKEEDSQFLVDAAEINMEEIELGKIAQSQGTMADVKEMGKMMVDDHTKALNELRSLAAKKQVTLPASASDATMSKAKSFAEKKGADFDDDYCDEMVSGHKDAISKFEKAATDCQDTEIKAWANSMLPGLRAHLDHAMMCQKKADAMDAKK